MEVRVKKMHMVVLLVLVVGLVGCDHTTKQLARTELRGQDPIGLISGVIDLTYTENRDLGFSALRRLPDGIRRPIVLGSGVIGMVMLVAVWAFRRRAPWTEQLGYALFLAGALGNGLDRLVLGYVVDFIHLHYWPIFNVADICITAGALVLLLRWRRAADPPVRAPA
jgi:signal peptidase II